MALLPAPVGKRRGTGWGGPSTGLVASTRLVAAEPVLGLSPAHGPSARVLHGAGCQRQLHGEGVSNPLRQCRVPALGSPQHLAGPRGTCAMYGEQAGVSHWLIPVCLELVQAQPTSLERWKWWAGSAQLLGLPGISVSGG